MTLDDVVAQVLAANPTVVQSRLSAQRFHALVGAATGQGLPQVRVGVSDTYSSVPTSAANAGSTPLVSTTGGIPVVNDSAFSSVTSGTSGSGVTTLASGSGSSTTNTIATTIIPVGGIPSSGTSTTTTGSSAPSSSGSSSTGSATGQAVPIGQRNATTSDGVTISRGRVNNYGATGSVTQIIDVFGMVKANENVAKKNAQFSDLDVKRVENDTALSAKNTYFAVLKAQNDVATDQEQLANAQAILSNAQVKYNAGASPQFDVISAQAQVSSAQAALINAQNELEVERALLNNLMARPIKAPVNLAPVSLTTVPPATPLDPEVAKAYQNRPEVQQTVLTQDIARNITHLAHQGMLPSVGLTGAVGFQPYTTVGSSHYTSSVTASVSVPLFDGGIAESQVRAAQFSEATQRSVAEQIRENVALEVQSALVNVVNDQNLVTADQATVASDREALRIAQVRYAAGVGTLLDVTNAEANLANAENNLNSATFQQQTAYAALLRAEGGR